MKFVEKVGNIKVYTKNKENCKGIVIILVNGSDVIMRELYGNCTVKQAIETIFKHLDIYTEEYIYLFTDAKKISKNTYQVNNEDWFCRIDDTRFFKHFNRSKEEFIADKNGKRIIDK